MKKWIVMNRIFYSYDKACDHASVIFRKTGVIVAVEEYNGPRTLFSKRY